MPACRIPSRIRYIESIRKKAGTSDNAADDPHVDESPYQDIFAYGDT
jgi:hypothetical protein